METSSSLGSSVASSVGSTTPLTRRSDDIGWEYGELIMGSSLYKVKCKLCNKVVSGGIYRLKQHVACIKGNVASCAKSTPIDQAKCKQALQDGKKTRFGQTKLLSRFSEESERMMLKKVSLPRASMKISVGRANDGAVTRDGQLKFPKAMKRKFKPLVETDDEENQPLAMRRVRASAGAKLAAGNASSSAADAAASEAGVTGLVSGRKLKLVVRRPELEYKINMETAEAIARQAQRQMRRFTSTFTEMCTSFKTSKKKYEELGKQVTDLKGQIQHWEDEKANWDEKKKELERERDEARKEALEAVGEKRVLEAEDAKVSAKKAIYEGLGNFVAHLANCEGRSLEDYVNEFVKEMPRDDRAPSADGSVHVAGHEGDGAIKYEAP